MNKGFDLSDNTISLAVRASYSQRRYWGTSRSPYQKNDSSEQIQRQIGGTTLGRYTKLMQRRQMYEHSINNRWK